MIYGEGAAQAGRNANYNILQTAPAVCNKSALKCQVDRLPGAAPSLFKTKCEAVVFRPLLHR